MVRALVRLLVLAATLALPLLAGATVTDFNARRIVGVRIDFYDEFDAHIDSLSDGSQNFDPGEVLLKASAFKPGATCTASQLSFWKAAADSFIVTAKSSVGFSLEGFVGRARHYPYSIVIGNFDLDSAAAYRLEGTASSLGSVMLIVAKRGVGSSGTYRSPVGLSPFSFSGTLDSPGSYWFMVIVGEEMTCILECTSDADVDIRFVLTSGGSVRNEELTWGHIKALYR